MASSSVEYRRSSVAITRASIASCSVGSRIAARRFLFVGDGDAAAVESGDSSPPSL